jgi:hypothetical protein
MSAAILDLNDRNLRLWQEGEVLLESPGYAWLEGREYQFGGTALDQARLHPRHINHRFWWQLNVEPLQPQFGPGRHSADLVHAHLLDIHQQGGRPDEIIIAAPGSLQNDQLSLLLGIIQQCPFTAVGLVDRAVASAAAVATGGTCWHINLQLHQALVTRLNVVDGHLQRDSVTPIPGCGWLALQDKLANTIADVFINQTRFDPRRKAASEQNLYDQLPTALAQLQTQDVCNLEVGGHRVRVEGRALEQSCTGHYERLAQAVAGHDGQVILDASIVNLPGIRTQFADATLLEPGSLSSTVEQHRELIAGGAEGVHFITRLPATATASPEQSATVVTSPAPAPPAEHTPATQGVTATRAEPISFRISIDERGCTLHPDGGPQPQLNGTPITGPCQFTDRDVLDLGNGKQLRLSQIEAMNGSQA